MLATSTETPLSMPSVPRIVMINAPHPFIGSRMQTGAEVESVR